MNIFATYNSPRKSAIALDDKRVIKMILESMQMLSTAVYFYRGKAPYKPSFVNHPCTKWARKNQANYQWLLKHFFYLFKEYKHRYKRHHKCERFYKILKSGKKYLPKGKQTPFADCAGLPKKYKSLTKITDRYRQCLSNKWLKDKRKPKWSKRNKPYWYYKFKKGKSYVQSKSA